MNLSKFVTSTQRRLHENSQVLLSSIAATGVLTTGYLAARAGYRTAVIFRDVDDDLPAVQKAQLVWMEYLPAAASGAITVSCIFAALKVGNRKTAAAHTALAVSERLFSEYRDKVVAQIGETKEQKLRDEIAQDRVNSNPPSTKEIIIACPGTVLCCEDFTGRYFTSDVESLRKAQNDINAKLIGHGYATLDDFYYLIGIPSTSSSNDIGWDSDKMMNLEFSTTLTQDARPCLVFTYNYTKHI